MSTETNITAESVQALRDGTVGVSAGPWTRHEPGEEETLVIQNDADAKEVVTIPWGRDTGGNAHRDASHIARCSPEFIAALCDSWLAREAERGWQPIATAPKDGTPVLIVRWGEVEPDDDLGPEAGVVAHWANWADREGWYAASFPTLSDHDGSLFPGNGEVTDNGWPEEVGPTHWMLLPAPPQSDSPKHIVAGEPA